MRDDTEAILNALFPFAQQMLQKRGAFHPFGAHLDSNGKLVLDSALANHAHAASQNLVAVLRQAYKEKAKSGSIRACGVCYDTRIGSATSKTDAIVADLESPGDYARVALPYRKRLFRPYTYESVVRLPMDRVVYPSLE